MLSTSASEKFAIIKETVSKENNLLSISALCKMAGVSRSGYYHYLETESL